MNLERILEQPIFERSRVLAGTKLTDIEVRWVHSVNEPDPLPWIRPGQLLLSTGQGISRDPSTQRQLVRRLHKKGVAALAIAVPRYFDEVPMALIEEASRLDLPLIELPWNLPFVEITEAVHQLMLKEQHHLLEASANIHRTLTEAAIHLDGLQNLASILGELISRAVVIEAADGRLMGVHRRVESEDFIRQQTLKAGQTAIEWEQFVADLGLSELLATSERPVRVPGSADGRIAARVICPVWAFDTRVATVAIIEGERTLTDLDIRAAEHAATIAALYISHQREIVETESRVGATLLDALLESGSDLSPASLERIRILGLKEHEQWKLAVIELPVQVPMAARDLSNRDKIVRDMRDSLRSIGANGLVTSQVNRIIGLLPYKLCRRVLGDMPSTGCKVVASPAFDDLKLSARQYMTILKVLPLMDGPGYYDFDEFLTARLIAGDNTAAIELVDRFLAPLSSTNSGDALVETLRSLCRNCFHLNHSASELKIHISTLRYRMARIEQLLQVNLKDSSDRFNIQLALEAQALFALRSSIG